MVQQEKVEQVSNVVAQVSAVASVSSCIWHWLDANHYQIAALCAIISTAVAVIGACINGYERFIKNK